MLCEYTDDLHSSNVRSITFAKGASLSYICSIHPEGSRIFSASTYLPPDTLKLSDSVKRGKSFQRFFQTYPILFWQCPSVLYALPVTFLVSDKYHDESLAWSNFCLFTLLILQKPKLSEAGKVIYLMSFVLKTTLV